MTHSSFVLLLTRLAKLKRFCFLNNDFVWNAFHSFEVPSSSCCFYESTTQSLIIYCQRLQSNLANSFTRVEDDVHLLKNELNDLHPVGQWSTMLVSQVRYFSWCINKECFHPVLSGTCRHMCSHMFRFVPRISSACPLACINTPREISNMSRVSLPA